MNSGHVRAVRLFVERINLNCAWNRFNVDFKHIHEVNDVSSVAIIDHFFWSDNLDSSVIDAGVIHSIENPSDHSPIYCVIDSDILNQKEENPAVSVSRPSWKRASEEEKLAFRETIVAKLSNINIPAAASECKNLQCDNQDHREKIDDYTEAILEAINDGPHDCLPLPNVKQSKSKIFPGWNEEV